MSKTDHYRQCVLEKKDDHDRRHRQTTYLPEKFAVVGETVKLKQDDESWDDGWKVVRAGELQAAEYVESHERDHLKTRKASDI